MPRIFIGVGSNIEPLVHIPAALVELLARGVVVDASSRFYRTEAIGRPEQPPYANGVWCGRCSIDPHELRAVLRGVEGRLGRVRSPDKYAPRQIDLDTLLYGDLILADGEIELPDPQILERPFLVRCLLEIEPDLKLPGESRPLADIEIAGSSSFEEYRDITLRVRQQLENER